MSKICALNKYGGPSFFSLFCKSVILHIFAQNMYNVAYDTF